jgi:hypothetical protein
MKQGYYVPFPYPVLETCDITPAALCIRHTPFSVKILLTESGSIIDGRVGKMKNPFSNVRMKPEKVKYYDKCIITTQKDSTNTLPSLSFQPAKIDQVEFQVTKPIVGAFDITNVATFKFKPGSRISELGGEFVLTFPPRYTALGDRQLYSFEDPFSCESPNIAEGLDQFVESDYSTTQQKTISTYKIRYEKISGSMFDEVVINCKYFRNPIVPEVVTGFMIRTNDVNGK